MHKSYYKFKVCNDHLLHLYQAIEEGDLAMVYRIEHELTPQEECVACAYALKAQGPVRQELNSFLRKEGLVVENNQPPVLVNALMFWGGKALMFLFIYFLCLTVVSFILSEFSFSFTPTLNGFAYIGVFIFTITLTVLFDYVV